jgi:AcrR family transcriptional regulator
MSQGQPKDQTGTGVPTGSAATEGPTSARIVATAAALFRQKGYAESSTRELADLLGIRKASLYHHIATKEEVLFRICVESLTGITESVSKAAAAADPPARLQAMIKAHVVEAVNARDMHAVMLSELKGLTREHRTEVVQLRDAYEALIRDAIVQDQERGALRSDISAKYLTLSLLNVLNWTIFWWNPDGDLNASDLGVLLAAIYLDGATARSGATTIPGGGE